MSVGIVDAVLAFVAVGNMGASECENEPPRVRRASCRVKNAKDTAGVIVEKVHRWGVLAVGITGFRERMEYAFLHELLAKVGKRVRSGVVRVCVW